MLVPSERMVLFAGIVLAPAAVLPLLGPGYLWAAAAAALAFGLVATTDAARVQRVLDGYSAKFDPVTRMTKDQAGDVTVRLQRGSPGARRLRLGLQFPRTFAADEPVLHVALPEEGDEVLVRWSCVPRRRGRYDIRNVYAEAISPLGLWAWRRTLPAEGELRVYPNLGPERRRLAALFLNRGFTGLHAQRQVGKGRDFEQLREYIPGDSYEDIHWKATARRGEPVTKLFQVERTQEVYVVIDAARLSGREVGEPSGSGETTQLERFMNAALVLALVAERQGDHFGLIAFDDRVRRFIRARSGKSHFDTCRDALYSLEPTSVNPDYEEVLSFIRMRLRKRALLIFLTSLDDPVLAETFEHHADLIARNHLVLVTMLSPPGVEPLFEGPLPESVDGVYARLGGHLEWQELMELKRRLHVQSITMNLASHEGLAADLVTQYINQKRRQRL